MFSFPDKGDFGELTPVDLKKFSGQLILYGAGKVAEVVDYVLRQQGIEYLCFCDTYRAGGTHCGHRIISPEEMEQAYPGIPVLITTIQHRNVVDSLKQYSPRKILDSVPLLVEVDFSDWGRSGEHMTAEWAVRTITSYLTSMLSARNPFYFQELTVFVTQKCNLRCLDCSAMVPYCSAPKHYDPDIIMCSLKNLLSYEGIRFQEICLLGGEPFLYPDLAKVLKFALANTHHEQVSIVTNGTMLPESELIPFMQDPRFFMRISDYGSLSRKKDELIGLLRKYSIRYELDNYSEWYENRTYLVEHCDEDEAARKYSFCTSIRYRPLINGKFFACCKSAHLCQLGAFAATPDNSIDCIEPNGLRERLHAGLKHFEECGHLDICHQCSGIAQINPDKMVPPAIQTPELLHL